MHMARPRTSALTPLASAPPAPSLTTPLCTQVHPLGCEPLNRNNSRRQLQSTRCCVPCVWRASVWVMHLLRTSLALSFPRFFQLLPDLKLVIQTRVVCRVRYGRKLEFWHSSSSRRCTVAFWCRQRNV